MATIVLVCGNGAGLTAGDIIIRDELDAAGHTVVPVSDDDPEYTGAYDGVVVSDSSSGGTVGSKYDTVAKPGVTFENVQWRLGTAVGAGSAITQWAVTSTPELSAGLSGAVTIYDGVGQTQQGLDVGSLPGGAQVIATDETDPDKATYVAYEAGSALTSGTAPARRVFLRVGDGALDNLTEDGLALLDAALDWSFGDPGGAPTVDVGADVPSWPAGTEFERSAVVNDRGVPVTSQEWTITNGPTGVGTTIGTSDTLLWTPTTLGTYTIECTATNADGSGSDSLNITVVDGGTPAGYPSIVQSAQVISDTIPSSSAEGTLPAAATAGNLLVFCLAGDKNTGDIAVSDNMSPSTEWTVETSMPAADVSLYIAWKVAVGGEVDFGADSTLPAPSGYTGWVVELTQDGASAWGVVAKAQALSDGTEVSARSSGTTLAATFDGLAVAVTAVDSIERISGGTQSWGAGYTARNTPPADGVDGDAGAAGCYTATNTVAQGTTTGTVFSTTVGTDQMSGAVVVFGREGTVAETPPGAVFDLSNWKLQLPTGPSQGDVDEIEQPELDTYSDENFFLNASNEMVGIAPVVGVTTSDESGATRCELREMEAGAEAAWDPATTELRQLTVTMRPDPTGASPREEMISAQIHGVSGTPPVYAAAEYHVTEPRIRIFKGAPNGGGQDPNPVVGITTADNITIRFRVVDATVDVFVAIGFVEDLPTTPQFSWPVSDFSDNTGWYFKTLTYNKSQIDDADAGGESINTISYLELIQPGAPTTGALDATLPLPVAQLTGGPAASGALDATLPSLGADLTGTASAAGALDAVLPLPVSSITGTTAATGALDSTLPAPTAALTGTVEGTGALDGDLPALTAALTGTAPVGGVLAGNLPIPVADLDAAAGTSGALDATLPNLTAALAGTAPVGGVLAAGLPLPVADLNATTEGTATLDATLPLPVAAVTGTVTGGGQLDSALPLLVANLTASDIIDGALDGVLPELSATLAGTVTDVGPVDATLPGLRADLDATVTTTGAIDATLPLPGADLRGRVTAEAGVLDGSLPMPTAHLDGTATTSGVLDGVLPLPVMELAGISGGEATLDATLPALVATFTGVAPVGASLDAALPLPTAALGGVVAENELDATLPLPVAAFTTHLTVPGVLAATLPLLTADLRTLPPPSYTPPLHSGQPRWDGGYRSGDPMDGRAA